MKRRLSAKQILKKLEAAGFDMEAVHSVGTGTVTIGITGERGFVECDDESSDRHEKAIAAFEKIFDWGYLGLGWGGQEYKQNYKPVDMGDWNDPSSRHHY